MTIKTLKHPQNAKLNVYLENADVLVNNIIKTRVVFHKIYSDT